MRAGAAYGSTTAATPLHLAICGLNDSSLEGAEPKLATTRALLDAGAPVNVADSDGRQALHLAAQEGCVDLARLLLDRGADVAATATARGLTAIHLAVQHGHTEVTRLLLDHGANVNAVTASEPEDGNFAGCQPLHIAAFHRYAAVVELLLSRGADVRATAILGGAADATPLHFAVAGSAEPESVVAVLGALLDAGAPVDAADGNKWQALHWAAMQQAHEGAALLLARGADVNAADSNGATALHVAALHLDCPGAVDVVKELLRRGANVCTASCGGRTPLDVAAKCDRLPELVRWMLELAADKGAADVRAGVQHAVVGMAAEAARLQRQQAALAHERAAWEKERAAWKQERAALEAARSGGGGGGGGGGGSVRHDK